jgi:hypothetical protein
MLKISHRGNINGSNPIHENNPHHVMNVIYSGYDVEIDIWSMFDGIFLGHDAPKYKVDYHFLVNKHLWIHCKNHEAIVYLYQDKKLNVFYHKEDITITSQGYLWTAPGLLLSKQSIAVMPELAKDWDFKSAYGVCTDYL